MCPGGPFGFGTQTGLILDQAEGRSPDRCQPFEHFATNAARFESRARRRYNDSSSEVWRILGLPVALMSYPTCDKDHRPVIRFLGALWEGLNRSNPPNWRQQPAVTVPRI